MSSVAPASAERHDPQARQDGPAWRNSGVPATLLAIWLALTIARVFDTQPLQSANDRSRWATVWSLVEEGTYQIDTIRRRPGWDTIDLVKHEGHFYSSKPPLLSTLVAGLYWLEKQTLGWTLDDQLEATTRLLMIVINVIPMFIALVLLAGLLERYSTLFFTRLFILSLACFGTLLSPFLPALNNHTPGAVSVLFALAAAIPVIRDRNGSGWRFALAGFWAACACCVELPAAAFGIALFLLLAAADWKRTLAWFVPAALIPLAAFFYTNYLATGGWKPFYLYYGTGKYEFIHQGVPSYWMNPRGIDRAADSPLTYLLHSTIGHHGVFSLSPAFLLTLVGWLRFRRWRASPLAAVHWLGLSLSLIVFGFFMTKTENYNYGGVSVALRWLLWLVPFWLLAIIPALDEWNPGRSGRILCAILLSASVFSAWESFAGPWRQPWLFRVMTDAGWIDYSDPPTPAPAPLHAWICSAPDADSAEVIEDYWIVYEGLDAEGRTTRLRIADGGGVDITGTSVRRISFTRSTEGMPEEEQRLTLAVEPLLAGAPVDDILLWPEGEPSAEEVEAARKLLRGLPAARPYAPGKMRYIQSPLREEAFQTRHFASRVRATPREHPRPAVYRRDVWTTEDVPFGVLEFRVSIHDLRTGELVRQNTMRAVDAGRVAPFDADRLVFE